MTSKMPEKPKTQKDQISTLWDVIKHITVNELTNLNLKLNIKLGGLIFIAMMIAVLGVMVAFNG